MKLHPIFHHEHTSIDSIAGAVKEIKNKLSSTQRTELKHVKRSVSIGLFQLEVVICTAIFTTEMETDNYEL